MIDVEKYVTEKLGVSPNMSGKIHCKCPFHDDSTASFSFDIAKGLFICGSTKCGVRGNFPLFYKMLENIDSWKDVYDKLKAQKVATNFDELFARKNTVKQKLVDANAFPSNVEQIINIDYLNERGLYSDVVNRFQIVYGVEGKFDGVDIEKTIIFPIYDIDGTYKTFQVRALQPHIKRRWQHPLGSPAQNLLYGGWLIEPNKHMFIVEGASDVWKLHTYGIQAVGLFTKEATPSQLNKIYELCLTKQVSPVVCLDGDAAKKEKKKGITYTDIIVMNLCAFGVVPTTVYLEEHEDPGSLSAERVKEIVNEL